MKRILLATGNDGKRAEVAAYLLPLGWEVVTSGSLGMTSPEEMRADAGGTFSGNATLKAEHAMAQLAARPEAAEFTLILADDSGICVDALAGAPGVDSAYFGGFPALLAAMKDIPDGEGRRAAQFVCVLAAARPGRPTLLFSGVVPGTVATAARGSNGFGYDPVFVPQGTALTFGEMSPAEKEALGHRGRAMAQFTAWLGAQG